ncbi:alpha-1,6-mannosyl-glycoprotein 2-beta-N-acetylglucosaminyltransferase isoform X2 [Wolffia australiana]
MLLIDRRWARPEDQTRGNLERRAESRGEMENVGGENSVHINVPPVEGLGGGGTGYGWADNGFEISHPFPRQMDPSKVPTADFVHVWCMPSTSNVGQQELPQKLEPESVQIALRSKVSWGGQSTAGSVQIQCSDLSSPSGDRLIVGQSLSLRKVVPVLGVPDALVPLDCPVCQINLFSGETTSIWLSVDIPCGQPPGQYEGQLLVTALSMNSESSTQTTAKCEKGQLYEELKTCLDIVDSVDGKPFEEVVERAKFTSSALRRILLLPCFSEFSSDYGDVMEEDVLTNLAVRLKLCVTVWEFTLPLTPSLPVVFGVSETVIEDRFGVGHGTNEWYDALDQHFLWLLKHRISPFFCRWGDSMRVLAYTCPWSADHPNSEKYYSDPRLAAYAVPYGPILSCDDAAKDTLQKELEILKTKPHWRKAYFYLWDEPLNLEQYNCIKDMSTQIRLHAPDARVLTSYYCGPGDAPISDNSFENFLKVPALLRPHTQIFCTSEWVLGNREDLVKNIISELQPENHEEWWTYVCMGPTDPHPNWHLGMRGTQHRAVLWRVWKEGGTGFLYWGANCYEKATVPGAEVRFRRGLPPGDGVLFYPGEAFSSKGPIASLRLERFLSGMQDIEYLRLYSEKFGREEALALLEKAGVYLGPDRYTLDHMPIDFMRSEIYRCCRS